ncbi:MAG: outer membrane beta-barrel protein [Bacteroidales bacterium]|nr:outer membrane beta-barrel protein [Bacteroidales bacterium]
MHTTSAQLHRVSGTVKDDSGEPLINAVLMFYSQADSSHAVADLDGYFQHYLPAGSYRYAVLYIGKRYIPSNNSFTLHQADTSLGEIAIAVESHGIEQVVVVGQRPFVTYRGNTQIYNLKVNPAAAGGNMMDGIKQIPGIHSDGESLKAFGYSKLAVAVDGQLLPMSDEEIAAYLATLSVDDAESVELIRNPDPEYGADVDAVLNIVSSRHANDGVNAFLSANAIYQTLWSGDARGRVNLNRGISRNYLAYSFGQRRRRETLTTTFGADTTDIAPRTTHQVQQGTDLALGRRYTLGIRNILSFNNEHNTFNTQNSIDMRQRSLYSNIYSRLHGEKWRWTTNVNLSFGNNSTEYIGNTAFLSQNDISSRYHNIRSTFTYDITSNFTAQISVSEMNNKYNSERRTDTQTDESQLEEQTYSSFLTMEYHNNKLYASASLVGSCDHRKLYESLTDTLYQQKLWAWQPFAKITYDVSRQQRLWANFYTDYARPSMRDMLPYVSTSSTILPRIGNPNLRNSTGYNLSLGYSYMRAASLEMIYSHKNDAIVEHLTPYAGSYIIAKDNLKKSRYLRMIAVLPVPVNMFVKMDFARWMFTTVFAYHHQWDSGVLNNSLYDKQFDAFYLYHQQAFDFKRDWHFDAAITYYSPLYFGVYSTEKQYWLSCTLSKRVGDWKFSLNGYDLFNTNIARGKFNDILVDARFELNWHCPKITFAITYNIGKKQMKSYEDRRIENADSRLSNDTNEGVKVGG